MDRASARTEGVGASSFPDNQGAVKTGPTDDGPHRVLLIEADTGVGRMILLALRSAGFEPMLARTGSEALRVLDETVVHGVVLDLELPDGLGGRVLSQLRESEPQGSSALPWVVLSAQDLEELTALYGPVGGRFLSKPFDPWHLVEILREAMGQ